MTFPALIRIELSTEEIIVAVRLNIQGQLPQDHDQLMTALVLECRRVAGFEQPRDDIVGGDFNLGIQGTFVFDKGNVPSS
jgi:hypothetical protein